MATLAQFRTRISAKLGLDNSASGDQTLIDDWVNEGYEDVLLRTRCKVSSATMDLTAGTADYTLPTDILAAIDMDIATSTDTFPLVRTDAEDILRRRRASTSTDSPSRFYAVEGSNLLLVYPTPSAADTITIYYVPRPTALSATSDEPSDIPSEFHKAIEFYALAEGADYDDDASSAQGERYRILYEQKLFELRKSMRWKGGRRLAPASVGRRRIPAHDPSADIR